MKIALVHDYFVQQGGAERVMVSLHRLFPEAPIYTTIAEREIVEAILPGADVRTSWMQHLPGRRRHYRKYFALYPYGIESLDLSEFDLVISNSSAYAKSVRTRPDACHVCYCHTPMRFAWEFDKYAAHEGWTRATHLALGPLISRVKDWDLRTAQRPTAYLANSSAVARRIQRCYGLPSVVVHPPVDVDRFTPVDTESTYHLVVSRLLGYKRIDLAVQAFTRMGRELVVIGDGPMRAQLERMAGPSIRFLGRIPDQDVADHYARCRALIFPGEEDFGLTPLEANASGRPVIAYAGGGALDTVAEGLSGVFFREQDMDALITAVGVADRTAWDPPAIRRHAEQFREEAFRLRMLRAIRTVARRKLGASLGDLDDNRAVAHRDRQ